MKSLSEIIETIKSLKNFNNDYQVAEILKILPKSLATAKSRNSIPYEDLASFCNNENLSLNWLLSDIGPKTLPKNSFEEPLIQDVCESTPGEFVNIPHFSDRISAGGGLVPINNVDIKIAFRRDWIRRKGDSSKMSLISVSGDSMFPTLMAGDLVLINHAQNYIDPHGGIYAIALGEVILIKRLQILYPSGKIRVTSDNAKYDSIDLSPDEVRINGRVIWFGREL